MAAINASTTSSLAKVIESFGRSIASLDDAAKIVHSGIRVEPSKATRISSLLEKAAGESQSGVLALLKSERAAAEAVHPLADNILTDALNLSYRAGGWSQLARDYNRVGVPTTTARVIGEARTRLLDAVELLSPAAR